MIRPGIRSGSSAPDGAPSALIAVPYSATRIDVFWTNGSTNEDSFNIYGSTDGVNFSVYDTAVAGSTSQNMTGLTAGTNYWFYVTAVKDIESVPSNTVSSYTLPSELTDGHTLLWIPYEDDSLYTLSGNDILELTDKFGSGRKFVGGTVKPVKTINGIELLTLNAEMIAIFNFSAIYTLYLVLQPMRYRAGTTLMTLSAGGGISYRDDGNNRYRYLNGAVGSFQNADNSALGDVSVFMCGCKKDTTTGFFQIDEGAADTGYVGLTDLKSIAFKASGDPSSNSGFRIKEIILRDQYEYGTVALTNLYNYCVKKK
jgi:hypothetical protein